MKTLLCHIVSKCMKTSETPIRKIGLYNKNCIRSPPYILLPSGVELEKAVTALSVIAVSEAKVMTTTAIIFRLQTIVQQTC
jgi:hypothetical protein